MPRAIIVLLFVFSFTSFANAEDQTCEIRIGEQVGLPRTSCEATAAALNTRDTYTFEREYRRYILETIASSLRTSGENPQSS